MKKKKLLFGLIVFAAFLTIFPLNAAANIYSGAWEPLHTTVFYIEIGDQDNDNYSLLMYDWGNTSTTLEILVDGDFPNLTNVYFTYVTDTWYAGLTEGATTLDLGDDQWFGLCFYNEDKDPTAINYSYDLGFVSDNYVLTDDQSGEDSTNMVVVVHDASPIPIPSTVWIFGTGLIGLVGIRRKLRN